MSLTMSMMQPVAPIDALASDVQLIGANFAAAYNRCGARPSFLPNLKVETHPALISYEPSDRTVRVSRYSELPPELQGLMTGWAEAAGMEDSQTLFVDVFNSLLVPHELGHWAQHVSGRLAGLDRWESELEANRIAIAFWRIHETTGGALPARIDAFTGFLGRLPNPVPDGQDPRAFFNDNYETLDSMQYGWFQGALMQEAWTNPENVSFCELVQPEAVVP
ncbi:hypothetical protein IP79_06010 [Porphyrobacter sp. AAP60]|nr:hypothetical protein IP79_06010 [Porphyrobacter sp. AAP60]